MNPRSRIEEIPQLLFFINLAFFITIIPIGAIIGTESLLFAAAIPVMAYALGAYDFPTASPRRALNAHHYATFVSCTCFIIYEAFGTVLISDNSAGSVTLLIGLFLSFSVAHRIIVKTMLSGAQSVTLRLPPVLEPVQKTFNSFIEFVGYPAEVELGASTPTVTITSSARNFTDEPEQIELDFDPLRFFDIAARALPPELLELYPDYINQHRNPRAGYVTIKRAADIIVSIFLLILTGPLWIFASVGILISDGPPIFFVQPRVGQKGRLFRLIKFRTLRPALPKRTPTENIAHRKFAFGSLLRKTRIDELPQLLQVIVGSMSLVGPRPEMIFGGMHLTPVHATSGVLGLVHAHA